MSLCLFLCPVLYLTVKRTEPSEDPMRIRASALIAIVSIFAIAFFCFLPSSAAKPYRSFAVHAPTKQIAINPSGTLVAIITTEGQLVLYDIATAQFVAVDREVSGASSIAFSPNGIFLAVGTIEGSILLWNTNTKHIQSRIEEVSGHIEQRTISALAFSSDNKILAAGQESGIITVIEVNQFSITHRLKGTFDDTYLKVYPPVSTLAFSHSNKLLAVGFSFYSSLHVWDVQEGTLVTTLGELSYVKAIRFASDDSSILFVHGYDDVEEWLLREAKPKWRGFISTANLPAIILLHTSDTVVFAGPANYGFFGGLPFIGEDDHKIYIARITERELWNPSALSENQLYKLAAKSTLEGNNSLVISLAANQEETVLVSGNKNGIVNIYQLQR